MNTAVSRSFFIFHGVDLYEDHIPRQQNQFCREMQRIFSALCLFCLLFHPSLCAGKITESQMKVQKHRTDKPKQEPKDDIKDKQNTGDSYRSWLSLKDESTWIKHFEQDKHETTTDRVPQEENTASQIRLLPTSRTFLSQTQNPRKLSKGTHIHSSVLQFVSSSNRAGRKNDALSSSPFRHSRGDRDVLADWVTLEGTMSNMDHPTGTLPTLTDSLSGDRVKESSSLSLSPLRLQDDQTSTTAEDQRIQQISHETETDLESTTSTYTAKTRMGSTVSTVSTVSVTGVSLGDASADPNNTVFEIDLMMCDKSGGRGNITGDHGTVGIFNANLSGTFATRTVCRLRIIGSPGTFLSVSFDKFFSPKELSLHVIISDHSGDLYASFFEQERPPDLYFTVNWIEMLLLSYTPFHPTTLLTFISNPSRLDLNLTFLTDTYGFVTTPFFDGISTKYPPKLNSSAMIRLPREYISLMVSFEIFALKYESECITFFQEVNLTTTLYNVLLTVCGTDRVKTQIFSVSLRTEFASDLQITTLGFKMLFSFHTKEDEPRFARTGRYNCTSRNYELFKQHVECNLHEECENSEDELGCWYTSTNCKGAIAYENRCYSYVTWKASVTWNEASQICLLRNSELASLNTVEKTKYILNIIHRQRKWMKMYVGLKTSDPNLPKMYKTVLQWNDGKTALDLNFDRHEAPKYPSCGMVGDDEEWVFTMIDCNSDFLTQFLCEFHPAARTQTSLKSASTYNETNKNEHGGIPLRHTNQKELRLRLPAITICPNGHVTHDFLSCDPATDCSKDVFVDTCETENGGVIPLFICEDGVQTLAFTLVCNHQEDCRDGSDEDRCVFEECEGFLCDNLQCIRVSEVCDGMDHCLTGRDEERCSEVTSSSSSKVTRVVHTSVINLDGYGYHSVTISNRTQEQVKQILVRVLFA